MAVTSSYTTLLANVADYLARSDLTAYIPVFVQNCEERFYRDSENWASWMESALSVTITANLAAVPASYLGLRVAYIAGNYAQPLKRVTLEQLYSRWPRGLGSAGTVVCIARNGANFEFGPENVSGTLTGTMYAKPTVLRSFGSDAAAHFLIVNAPDLLLYGALLEAEPFLKNDARVALWKSAYDIALEAYRSRFRDEMYSGSTPFTVAV
jgi:hypothetical protein